MFKLIIIFIILVVAKIKLPSILFYSIALIAFGIIIVVTYNRVREIIYLWRPVLNLQHFGINSWRLDRSKRSELLLSHGSLILGILIIVMITGYVFNVNEQTLNMIGMPFFLILFALVMLYLSLLTKNYFSVMLLILTTNLLIFSSLLLGLLWVLSHAISLLEQTKTVEGFPKEMADSFVVVVLLPGMGFSIYGLLLAISFGLQLIMVYGRPAYFFDDTFKAYKLIAVIFTPLIFVLFFYSKELSTSIYNYLLIANTDTMVEFMDYINVKNADEFKNFFDKAAGSILLPFTVGTATCAFILDSAVSKNKGKAKRFFLEADRCASNASLVLDNDDLIRLFLKKALYYGGEDYELWIRIHPTLSSYLERLQIDDSNLPSISQRIRNWISNYLNRIRRIIVP